MTIQPRTQPAAAPDAVALLDRTRALLPLIRAHADGNDARRDVAPEVIAALKDAGLYKLFQSAAWGGYEADPRTFYEVQNLIAEACASTGWVFGVHRVQAVLPLIRAHADGNDARRDVAPEVIAALKDAGLYKLFQSAAWGGYEADPRTFYEVQNLIAEACASTGWVFGVHSVQAFLLSTMDRQAQADVWGDDPDTLMSSSFQPVGKVRAVDGGYRLSGRWTFSSGSSHAQWALLGALVPPAQEGQPPHMRLFLVPRADYRLSDTWHTIGLKGTGSNDIEVEDAFVPAYRTHAPTPGILPTVTATQLSPLYRLPWLYVFTSTVSNLSIGMARAALAAFLDIERVRVSSLTGKAGKDDPAVHGAIARLGAEIDAVDTMYKRQD